VSRWREGLPVRIFFEAEGEALKPQHKKSWWDADFSAGSLLGKKSSEERGEARLREFLPQGILSQGIRIL